MILGLSAKEKYEREHKISELDKEIKNLFDIYFKKLSQKTIANKEISQIAGEFIKKFNSLLIKHNIPKNVFYAIDMKPSSFRDVNKFIVGKINYTIKEQKGQKIARPDTSTKILNKRLSNIEVNINNKKTRKARDNFGWFFINISDTVFAVGTAGALVRKHKQQHSFQGFDTFE